MSEVNLFDKDNSFGNFKGIAYTYDFWDCETNPNNKINITEAKHFSECLEFSNSKYVKNQSDIKDVSNVLKHFFNMYNEKIYENHNDFFGDLDFPLITARVKSREMNKIAKRNEVLYNRIKDLLEVNTEDIEIVKIMVEFYENNIEENLTILKQMKAGYLE
ncbi:hypothetical protein FLJC2902T_13450 [Flavobacterium limnosediminis JC2902]|uniref:Uncharacterized protein n=1 Tax=Flavobacterium limnosediminis JC2902 TaxID=1341181 RepID=V6SWH2_9FLAO|nr:hypothetical protein [Flavobacterium limnosediminis]ESU28750.1 hypothetical protein FLJC2902T_13450 [Flavobacterium limnosediminis JC2902]